MIDESQIRRLVLTELARQGSPYVPVGISARHVHLCRRDMDILFGPGRELTPIKALSQPDQFAAAEQVTLVGPKGKIEKVRVLGYLRSETQVEVSMSDAFALGIKNAPIRMSGDLKGSAPVKLIGPAGELQLSSGLIIAARHLHMSDAQAAAFGVHNGQVIQVKVEGPRPCIVDGVVCRTGKGHELELHLDTDEANAFCLQSGGLVQVVVPGSDGHHEHKCSGSCKSCSGNCKSHKKEETPSAPAKPRKKPLELVTERDINDAFRDSQTVVTCTQKALITPAAADRAAETKIQIQRV